MTHVRDAIVRGLRRVLPFQLGRWIGEINDSLLIRRSPDRAVLTRQIFPAFLCTTEFGPGARVLWIGCRRYTKDYPRVIEQNGARCWTVDIVPRVGKWGSRERHVVGDVRTLDTLFDSGYFDAVLCNGIFGYGVNSAEDQRAACAAMSAVSKPDAWMLLGWDRNRPIAAEVASPWFRHDSLPGFGAHRVVENCEHVYDVYRRKA